MLQTEKIFAAKQIEIPHANEGVIVMVADILDIGVKMPPPMFECFRVMSSHDLKIKYFQALHFSCRDHLVE